MFPWFPHEAVPDGSVWVPHHYTYLTFLAAFAAATVWDDYRDREPLVVVGGLLGGLFGFLFMWPHGRFRQLGALCALLGPLAAVAWLLRPGGSWRTPVERGGYPTRTGAAVVALAVGGLDDAVEHAFPVPTPLDTLFGIVGVWGSVAIAVAVAAAAAAAASAWSRVPDVTPKL